MNDLRYRQNGQQITVTLCLTLWPWRLLPNSHWRRLQSSKIISTVYSDSGTSVRYLLNLHVSGLAVEGMLL